MPKCTQRINMDKAQRIFWGLKVAERVQGGVLLMQEWVHKGQDGKLEPYPTICKNVIYDKVSSSHKGVRKDLLK